MHRLKAQHMFLKLSKQNGANRLNFQPEFPVFPAYPLYGVPPGLLGQCISVAYPRGTKTCSDHVTRNASAAQTNEA